MKRPQLGSLPWNAVLQSVESPIARATRAASASDRAPATWISTTCAAPSPSATTSSVISASASVSAATKRRPDAELQAGARLRAAPLARSSTVSFVLVSPSTVAALSVVATAVRIAFRAKPAPSRASVMTKTRSVAMFGAIIPPPLPATASVTSRPPRRRRRTAVFGNASVVRIARAVSAKPRGESADRAASTPGRSTSCGTGTPIFPVAHARTAASGTPRARATRAVDTSTVRRPCGPVHAFALPAWTSTARARPLAMRACVTRTGAAAARLVVNTPAATAGRSATMSATSGPVAFKPLRTPAKRKPGTSTRWARRRSFIPWSPHEHGRAGGARSRGLAVTLLVLLPAAARAGIVPSDLLPVAPHRLDALRGGLAVAVDETHPGLRLLPAPLRIEDLARHRGRHLDRLATRDRLRRGGRALRDVHLDAPELL